MQYIAFIHGNSDSTPTMDAWNQFLQAAKESGMFQGGSALGKRHSIGKKQASDSTETIVGFMRFDTDDLTVLKRLLDTHPVILNGGTIELREMPVS